jgi:Ca2+-binding RTX toxin-like protein
MYGGTGNDVYFVDNLNDLVVENAGEGTDSVYFNVNDAAYTLPANVEKLIFVNIGNRDGYGNTLDNYINGNCGDNKLAGFEGNDTIYGGRGNDSIDGGVGNDKLYGGLGIDTIYGGEGNDYIMGEGQDDYLYGGLGNDTYAFSRGFGQDTISDKDASAENIDVIKLGEGITENDIAINRNANDLVISIKGTLDKLTVNNYFAETSVWASNGWVTSYDANKVEKILFDDGTQWEKSIIESKVIVSGEGTTIKGTIENDTLVGGEKDDKIYGNTGDDILDSVFTIASFEDICIISSTALQIVILSTSIHYVIARFTKEFIVF